MVLPRERNEDIHWVTIGCVVLRHSPLATVITGLSSQIRQELADTEKVISEMIDDCREK